MKKLFNLFLIGLFSCGLFSCSDDDDNDGDGSVSGVKKQFTKAELRYVDEDGDNAYQTYALEYTGNRLSAFVDGYGYSDNEGYKSDRTRTYSFTYSDGKVTAMKEVYNSKDNDGYSSNYTYNYTVVYAGDTVTVLDISNNSVEVCYVVDSKGRPAKKLYDWSYYEAYAYDGNGNLKTRSSYWDTELRDKTEYSYDNSASILSYQEVQPWVWFFLDEYQFGTYVGKNNVIRMQYTSYEYEDDNEDERISYIYDKDGYPTGITQDGQTFRNAFSYRTID